MQLQRTTLFLKVAIACAIISTLAFLCIPICSLRSGTTKKIFSLVVAGLFWGSLILEQVFFWIANAGRKRIQQRAFRMNQLKKASFGLITFGTSGEARICDIVLGVSLLTSVVLSIFRVQIEWLVVLSLAALLLSFNLHCILNGKNYRYIKAFQKIKKETRKSRGIHNEEV